MNEARTIRDKLKKREKELKRKGLYDAEEKRADLMGSGLVPLSRLQGSLSGYRRSATEIYAALNDAGLLRIEDHAPTSSSKPLSWIGINAKWDSLIEDIEIKGNAEEMFASSLGIMLCMAVDRRGITTVLPMARAIMFAEQNDGEISTEELRARYHGKALNILLERQREKIDKLKMFSSDDGKRLLVSRDTAYGIGLWQIEVNRLEQDRMRDRGRSR
ncbi:MAG: hypothetical protein Q8M92_01705 [Candidatus Subteraquimicrobiales bacterium]|nr:hypothetical protein [Candidatus Subteraquimicrobiales bacterium]